jgi:hypothetical protein
MEKTVEKVKVKVLEGRTRLGETNAIVELTPEKAKYWIDLKCAELVKTEKPKA